MHFLLHFLFLVFSSRVEVAMGNFYAGSKTSVHSCILTALMRKLSLQETYSNYCKNNLLMKTGRTYLYDSASDLY